MITGDRLLVSLLVTDQAGNTSESESILTIFDDTAGEIPVVLDQGDYVNPHKNELVFILDGPVRDPESGIEEVKWQLLAGNGLVSENDADWSEFSDGTAGNLKACIEGSDSPGDGETVVLAVRAVNRAGGVSYRYSDGIIIDETKPWIADVTLNNGLGWSYDNEVTVTVESFDEESPIVKVSGCRVEYQEGGWVYSGDTFEETNTPDIFSISLFDLNPGEKVWYEFSVEDSAGNVSLPFYSQGIYYKPENGGIDALSGNYSGGEFVFTWSNVEGALPFTDHKLSLEYDGGVIAEAALEGSETSWSYATDTEGYYTLIVESENLAGYRLVCSRTTLLDRTAPDVTDPDVAPYVSDSIEFSAGFDDGLSYVDQWRYRIGLPGEPGVITGGWISRDEITSAVEETFKFVDLTNGSDVVDTDRVLVELAARDRFGNWSETKAGEWALVDRTAPENISVSVSP